MNFFSLLNLFDCHSAIDFLEPKFERPWERGALEWEGWGGVRVRSWAGGQSGEPHLNCFQLIGRVVAGLEYVSRGSPAQVGTANSAVE